MTPKEKAKELVDKFLSKIPFADTNVYKDWKKEMNDKAKQCALIAVDEIIDFENRIVEQLKKITEDANGKFTCESKYWKEVKTEIEKI